jgi:hypothetical protein
VRVEPRKRHKSCKSHDTDNQCIAMKFLTGIVGIFLCFSGLSIASVDLEIGNGFVVETSDGIYVEIDGDLEETGNGYFKGKISSGDRAEITSFSGMMLSAGIEGSITRNTGPGYSKGNGEGNNFLRYYEVNNSGDMGTADVQISFLSSGNFDERNNLTDPYYIYRYAANWNGYGEGSAASPLSTSGVHILSGLTDWVISDSNFVFFVDDEVATTGTPILFNEPAEGGDGHEVEMTFSQLSRSGNVAVRQTNRSPSNLLNNKCLNYLWDISKDPGITSFATDVSFKYLDSDLLDVSEGSLVAAYYDDVQSEWSILPDRTLDDVNNSLTVHNLDHFTMFAIGETEAFIPTVSLNVKVYLEGPYDDVGDSLKTDLYDLGDLPLGQPFNASPWNYNGTESVSEIPEGVVDWVLVELRSSPDAGSKIVSRAAFLASDGNLVDLDGMSPAKVGAAPGDYYIVIYHRNHLAIMSAVSHSLNSSSTLYDFTLSQSSAYTTGVDAMANLGNGKFGMRSGDGNADNGVDAIDYNTVWLPQNGTPWSYSKYGDFNLDGGIDAIDYNLHWLPNNGTASQVPFTTSALPASNLRESESQNPGGIE